jgi:hypothetical protein
MIHMIGPTPGDKHIHVEKVLHGKSASSSRTDSVVSGAWFSNAAKISAPVRGQRIRRGALLTGGSALERRRKYSETLNPSFLACLRISRASSSVTLNVIVTIGNTVLPIRTPVKRR